MEGSGSAVNDAEGMDRGGSASQVGCGAGEGIEVALKRGLCRAVLIGSQDEVQQDLPGPANLAQASDRAAVARIVKREVDQFQSACEGPLRHLRIAGSPLERPADFAPDVSELFGERQSSPSPVGQLPMRDLGHRLTNSDTMAAILSRVFESSTPRVRFPKEGRRLIMESNSSHSLSGRSG